MTNDQASYEPLFLYLNGFESYPSNLKLAIS